VEALLAEGAEVTALARGAYPALEALGVRCVRADLSDAAAVSRAVRGHEVVFHVAAKAGVWGPYAAYRAVNVEGTANVIAACREHGVRRLVHTSSPSVTFDGKDHVRVKEDLPIADRFLCSYPRTKAEAEVLVRAANDDQLATCILRPHLIVGPRDPHLVPRLLRRGRAGRLAVIGDGTNEVSITWVENAADAHLAAARTLAPGAPHAGRAYFLSQRQPVRLWDWIGELFAGLGLPPVERRLSLRTAYAAGTVLEGLWRLFRRPGEPPMTRFVALQLATSHSYDPSPASEDFGYVERVPTADATRRLVEHLQKNGI
jgi:nucleoside-diphosphate-sugar epimerase